jgi:predicted O-linked N-acetylglucosamine transferase (SPINDLY family)
VLIDLGGPTGWNRPRLMARRLAPVQASWLGYAHSAGLSTLDHILLDPHLVPPDPALLIEAPLTLPSTWIAMSGVHFRDEPAPASEPPSLRNGFVTYGTANASYKYSPEGLDLWARVLAAAPGSRFLVVRPEAQAPSFREHFLAAFAARGVGAERVRFEPVRGGHLPFYADMDVSLDTAPLTGGTTTCESLWMGVPVVSLVGEALYERLSASILANAGLADLVATTPEDYVAVAVALGRDVERLTQLRRGLRDRLKAGPLGQTERFARDFYDLVAGLIR